MTLLDRCKCCITQHKKMKREKFGCILASAAPHLSPALTPLTTLWPNFKVPLAMILLHDNRSHVLKVVSIQMNVH